ncbi:unnamed protein product [Linum tenue]|uniref:Uncharacterized protein n=1 Tax=Linum tenue TaxID=586396 RepID=A0AAV0P1P8_9ROSI|nr:unnamed protein product [Linum tenue]
MAPGPGRVFYVLCVPCVNLLALCSFIFFSSSSHSPSWIRWPTSLSPREGYVGVGEKEKAQLFYYFVKSEGNPVDDPVVLWLTSGLGCSALSGLVYKIGSMNFEIVEYNGSLPSLVLNPDSGTQVASIIFVDMPVGTGFSYATTTEASQSSDFLQIQQAYVFLRKWLIDHPEFITNPVYVDGDSFSGLTVPGVVANISYGNAATDPLFENNFEIPYAFGHAIISYELYQGSIGTWQRCNYGLPYAHQIFRSVDDHLYLSEKGYRSLVYSGDHDMMVTYLGTQAWIRALNFSIIDDWRSWHVENQVAGYTRTYSNKMTFATVKGGGHTAPEYKPHECFAMFRSWISGEPL